MHHRHLLGKILVAALGTFAFDACKEDKPTSSSGSSICNGSLCMEVYRTFYSTQPCDGAEKETCQYANVFFVLNDGDKSVLDLSADDVEMRVNGREVGVEGTKSLTSSNGLLVSLLLDRSYSITEAGAEMAVKDAAKQFLDTLPDEAYVSVATFASEGEVPTLVCSDGSASTYGGSFSSPDEAKVSVEYHYDAYDAATSSSQTKIYDAVARWSEFSPSSAQLQRLQRVMVVMTDGSDTASINQKTAEATRKALETNDPELKLYAIGMGSDVDEKALGELSDGRVFLASSKSGLEKAFEEVGGALGAIYHLRVLVSTVETGATGDFKLTYEGATIENKFVLETNFVDEGVSVDPGESGPACGMFPEDFDPQRLAEARIAAGVGSNPDGDAGVGGDGGGMEGDAGLGGADGSTGGDGGSGALTTESFDSPPGNWFTDGDVEFAGGDAILTSIGGAQARMWTQVSYDFHSSELNVIELRNVRIGTTSTFCDIGLADEGSFEIFDGGARLPFAGSFGITLTSTDVRLMNFNTNEPESSRPGGASSYDFRIEKLGSAISVAITAYDGGGGVLFEDTLSGDLGDSEGPLGNAAVAVACVGGPPLAEGMLSVASIGYQLP